MSRLEVLGNILDRYTKKSIAVSMHEAHTKFAHALNRTGILTKIAGNKIYTTLHDVVTHMGVQTQ